MTPRQNYSHRVMMSGRGMLHLQWIDRFQGRAMCGRSVDGWSHSTAKAWECEQEIGYPFICTQCRDPLGPNVRIEP